MITSPVLFHTCKVHVRRLLLAVGFLLVALTTTAHDAQIDTLLDQGEAAIRREDCVAAIRHLTEAQKLLPRNYDVKQDFWINYYLGVGYFIVSEYDRALEYLFKSLTLCNKHRLSQGLRSRTLNAIAGIYFDQQAYDKAWNIVQQDIVRKDVQRDSSYFVTCATDLALIANKRAQYDTCEQWLRAARKHLPHKDSEEASDKIELIEAERLHLLHRYRELLPLARRLSQSPHIQKSDRTEALGYLIEACTKLGLIQEARQAARQAIPQASLKLKPELFAYIADFYEQSGELQQAIAFKDSVILYMDSINRKSNHELMAKMQMRLEMLQQQNETEKRLAQLIQHRRMLLLLALIIVLIATVAILAMRAKNRQHRFAMQLRLEKEHQERQEAEYLVRETELKAAFEQQMMKTDLEQKNRELSATTLFINSRNELLRDLIGQLQGILVEHSSPALRGLVLHLQQLLKSSDEKDTLTINFEKTNPDFFRIMKQHHDQLTDSDIRFLSYIKMNMPTKDIAALLNVNPDSIKRRKIRLSHKLGLYTSAELYTYVQGLS